MSYLIRFIVIVVLCSSGLDSLSQSQADWWYFGFGAGLHFTINGPVADTNGSLNTFEGCTAISDIYGNLLFYTDGITVYDSTHGIMPNGTGLFGNPSSVQSGVIVPFPDHPFKYYIFTTDSPSPTNHKGFRYSIVDLSLNGGLGDVDTTNKNILLFTPTCEKITAVADATNEGFWVAGYKGGTDSIFTYHLTSSGIGPQVFAGQGSLVTNSTSTFDRQCGQMKFSPNGRLLGIVQGRISGLSKIDLLEFDNTNGTCNNLLVIYADSNNGSRYGLEFSDNSKMLYTSTRGPGTLLQFNVGTYDSAAIASSLYIVDSNIRGSLQLGPDGKIYIPANDHVSRINNPQISGSACNIEANAVFLEGEISVMSLTTVVQSLVKQKFTFSSTCQGDTIVFRFPYSNEDSLIWNFGDIASGVNNTASDSVVSHYFQFAGTYFVSLQVWKNGSYYLVSDSIFILPEPHLNLPNDTAICIGDTFLIDITQPYSTYLWSSGDTSAFISITTDTQLIVTVFSFCDTISAPINVNYISVPQIELGNDTLICPEDSLWLSRPNEVEVEYRWFNGSNSVNITIDITSIVWLEATNQCGRASSDTMVVTKKTFPAINLGADTTICESDSIVLDATADNAIYYWSNGASTPLITASDTSSIYSVTVTINGCSEVFFREVNRSNEVCNNCTFLALNVFTPNADGINDVWTPESDCNLEGSSLLVYNRWGVLVFSGNNALRGWDGSINGSPASEGVYFYQVFQGSGKHIFQGSLSLLRD